MTDLQTLGSQTAKRGFANEDEIVASFNNWSHSTEAQKCLQAMGYKLEDIEAVYALRLSGYKTDVQIQVSIKLKSALDCQNLQVKLVSNPRGFNQIDKRWLAKYAEMWHIPPNVLALLKLYTGEEKPSSRANLRDKKGRRLFADELTEEEQKILLKWIEAHRSLIISDVLKGRGQFAAEWMLVVRKVGIVAEWAIAPMNYCLNFFGNGAIAISPRGTIKIGRITMQRKGGDTGRPSANMLQFKINPAELFLSDRYKA